MLSTKMFNGKQYSYIRTVKGVSQARTYIGMQKKLGLLARKVRIGTTNSFRMYTRKK